mmetsp:Transcript_34872/g.74357  ORF Transcript_34872/g.74357 Transcript_34872/m.74357 type:complete len:229 (+) Transcript_34872:98-784(+)|eukprot:CAMPEP_0172530800 /NCGR_PEP_ID=MMETSP1067-20121228/4429_1 /TAXON_ID=265564 ORGANISM="Thalassiosira punctigera, Strain Tpunct2005C2" /NCGR_SAMPLE_ID=MMETSP1067 /ASSEMBLY_ACC=CAM_ASM_000444 /LENGTH=228 /DNA_ID=CAMNT_0013315079 /DNA_START=87 /DNA_END=773 /DNA_ORIENTATION=+
MASLFKQLSEDMERIAQVVEEGAKFMMGDSTKMGEQGNGATPDPTTDTIFDDMDGIEDGYGSPLMGMADNVLSDIMSTQVGPQSPKEHIQAFTAAITWNEPFIQSLLAFHLLVIIIAIILSRKSGVYARMGLMVFAGIIVRLAERLNTMGASHWREFSTQNYFDKNGIFMGIMICAPLLMVCLFMLTSMIMEASNLIADVKQMKINSQREQKQKRKEKKEEKTRKKKD